ncbi:hypothetical protein FSP39_006356 [Pinctada imbricata]|uniref:Methyltransferase FkbM domain-containing protein n=1 Tax=Pinctada imbricata TaxID=66713 RepID=A0AA88Y303_PINIB|nr:hypothetical protein FSP39_006356 [Pinctada imbricata]
MHKTDGRDGYVTIWTNNNMESYTDCRLNKSIVRDKVKYSLTDSVNHDKLILFGYKDWDTISRKVKLNGHFEPQIDRIIHYILSKNPAAIFLDVGANIGIRSLQVAKRGIIVVAVEALTLNVAHFCESIYANGLENKITIVRNALAERRQFVRMGKFRNSMGASFVADDKDVMSARKGSIMGTFDENIRAITFDDLLQVSSIKDSDKIVIKLDIEGYEAHALKGASEFFTIKDIVAVVMEWRWHRGQKSAEDIFSFFDRHHFKCLQFQFERGVEQNGNFEPQIDKVIYYFLKRNPTALFIDLGANIGVRSLQVAKYGRKVIAVEALLENVYRLCRSIKDSNVSDEVRVIHNAIAERQKTVQIGRYAGCMGCSFVTDDKDVFQSRKKKMEGLFEEKIPAVTLDDLLQLEDVQSSNSIFMKMDIEGYEHHVFDGAGEFFRTKDVIGIIMEWTWHKGLDSGLHIFEFMKKNNFLPFMFNEHGDKYDLLNG